MFLDTNTHFEGVRSLPARKKSFFFTHRSVAPALELENGGSPGGEAPGNFLRFWLGKPCSELSTEQFLE